MSEAGDRADTSLIPVNNERIEAQLAAPVTVIVGNPPYSSGQDSANDDNANLKYPTLDARIAETYAAASSATNKNSLYDSYIRAFRWATDRLGEHGVVAFVSNNGWVDGNTADGIRKTFADEFSEIFVYNLRGNARTAGTVRQQEGGGVFDAGARTGVAVLIAVKRSDGRPCTVRYHGVADYLTREEKLAEIDDASLHTVAWQQITPNADGDWINQRNADFETFLPLGVKDSKTAGARVFEVFSAGVQTNRDAWCYNFSSHSVQSNMQRMIDTYNVQAATCQGDEKNLDLDPAKISWSRNIRRMAVAGKQAQFEPVGMRRALYRPFAKQTLYFDPVFNSVPGQNARFFPSPHHENIGMYVVAAGSDKPFAALMSDALPDLALWGSSSGQFFPRWRYERANSDAQDSLLTTADDVDAWGYRRVDNITDEAWALFVASFGPSVTKDDVFYYAYAVLHAPSYRQAFAADLKRMLPRLPMAASPSDFEAFVAAGRALADLHVNYESVEPYPLHETPVEGDPWQVYRVTKMKWADKATKKALGYNAQVTLSDIPAAAHEYQLGSRSALEWLIDRYRVTTHKESQITNDPNDWCREVGDPRYIVDLVKHITRVSIDTMNIVNSLPELPLG